MESFVVRIEAAADLPGIRRVNELAFGGTGEADLVEALRNAGALTLSLVAAAGQDIVGHIAFSPVTITGEETVSDALGLAPVAVLPERQKTGIGTRLITEGLKLCRQIGCGVVIVLGDPGYYGRFGFSPASRHGIRWEHEVPPENFMVSELYPGGLAGVGGIARYRPEFDSV